MGACGAGAAGSESQPYLEGGIEAADLFGGRLGGARCLRIGFGEDRGTRSLPGWALPGWALPEWALPEWALPEWALPEWALPEWALPEWALPEWALPEWALLGRRGDGLLGGAGSGDPAYKGAAAYDRASRPQGRSNSIAEYEFRVGPPS